MPGKVYNSPLRTDHNPSFVFYETNKYPDVEYMWKDMALCCSGSIFKLVAMLHGCSYGESFDIILKDFGIVDGEHNHKIVRYDRPEKIITDIRVRSIPFSDAGLAYWNQFGITPNLLSRYHTTEIDCLWTYDGQDIPFHVHKPTFAYRINKYYLIYSPLLPRKAKGRFINNLPPGYVFGFNQLPPYGDKLIIDKSAKDTIFCASINLDAVCSKGETILIPEVIMNNLHERFKDIYLMLDPDEAGRRATDEYLKLYPYLKPRFLEQAKDKTDLVKLVGVNQAKEIINQLIT